MSNTISEFSYTKMIKKLKSTFAEALAGASTATGAATGTALKDGKV
jgi:hypothetical protein